LRRHLIEAGSPMVPYLFWLLCLTAMGASYVVSDAYNSFTSNYSVLSVFF